MKMMDELKHLFLYSANQKVYAPVEETDKRRNSAILLLTTNINDSISLMKLPYIHNPNLFTSYYVDRNVMGYINASDFEELDEVKEKSVSEAAFLNVVDDIVNIRNIKFTIDDSATYVDRSYLYDVFKGKVASVFINALTIANTPKNVRVFVHHSVEDLQASAHKGIENIYHEKNYGYSRVGEIHVLSKVAYDQDTMWGDYYLYLKTELYNHILKHSNPDLPYCITKGISIYYSGLYDWLDVYDNNCSFNSNEKFFAKLTSQIIKDNQPELIRKFIKTNDVSILKKYATEKALSKIRKMIYEEGLTNEERNKLSDDEFGIPSKRSYPLNDEEHVRHAIKMFNYCDSRDEKELAENIIKKMKKYNITDVKVSDKNKFSKYYTSPKNESAAVDTETPSNKFEDVKRICNNLEDHELRRITFTDTYEDSKFVIKRIIKYRENEPAGFLDVHYFPTRPEIAQIVIAVDNRFRGTGVAKELVNDLLSSDLHEQYNFEMYYWTAHVDNIASQNLALSSGFIDTGKIDSYGRKVFINRVKEAEDYTKDAKIHNESTSIIHENGSIFLLEADSNSQKIRQYLYRDRLRTSKEVIDIYNQAKLLNPNIQKTYLELNMYKGFNLFVDLHYYHRLFMLNNTFKLDKGINMYFEFLNNLMNNSEINKIYKKKTVFIPVDYSSWSIQPGSDVGDYKFNINPISVINRLVRINPEALRRAWGNKDILFVGRRGYFKVDFSRFDFKNLPRFNSNIAKLMSSSEPIVDEYETDTEVTTKKALAAQAIDKIESDKNITVNDISKISSTKSFNNAPAHLRISTTPMNMEKHKYADKDIAIINVDSLDVGNMENLKKSPVYKDRLIDVYCVPK